MSLSKSSPEEQKPVSCQLCETGNRIHWRCEECSRFICNTCKKVHLTLVKDHSILDIKSVSIPSECQLCEIQTCLKWKCEECQRYICDICRKAHSKIPATKDHIISVIDYNGGNRPSVDGKKEVTDKINPVFKVVKQYTVGTKNIHRMGVSPDGSLWIGDSLSEKLQHIKLNADHLTEQLTLNIKTYSMAISPSGTPFIIGGGSTLQTICDTTGKITDYKITTDPWILSCVHVARDHNVIVGGHDGKGCGIVIVMDPNGKQLVKYDKGSAIMSFFKRPLLTYPRYIVAAGNSNLFISDGSFKDEKCRVVVVKPGGRDSNYYNGHSNT